MKNMLNNLQDALQERRLTAVTKALSELTERLAYQLRPPYTEVLHFTAREEDDRYAIEFAAKLHLHYSSLIATLVAVVACTSRALDEKTPHARRKTTSATLDCANTLLPTARRSSSNRSELISRFKGNPTSIDT